MRLLMKQFSGNGNGATPNGSIMKDTVLKLIQQRGTPTATAIGSTEEDAVVGPVLTGERLGEIN